MKSKIIMANCAEGTHSENCTFTTSETIDKRSLLAAFDGSGKVKISGALDAPFGVFTNTAKVGQLINVQLLGCGQTALMIASGTIKQGDILVASEQGCVSVIPSTSGEYKQVGIALGNATSGSRVEVLSCAPHVVAIG